MLFIVRTQFHTRPGERDLAIAAVKRLAKVLPQIYGSGRITSAVFASDSAPDILWEGEVQAESFGEAMQAQAEMFGDPEFQSINAELVKHLARAAKTELYALEE